MVKESQQKQVLVIEDEDELRRFSVWLLEAEGYHALQAADGDEGLKIAREQQVDLVLLDIRMPGRYGWDVLTEIKKAPSLCQTPVIIFTASADPDSKKKALEMGAADYLIKPVSVRFFKECIARVLSRNPGQTPA
jgi:DNA-binding response OmpR family regulator